MIRSASILLLCALAWPLAATSVAGAEPAIERVTTVAPFPRGLAFVDDRLYVLCRGRVRSSGGVSAEVNDQAGTIYIVDPSRAEPIDAYPVGNAVRANGTVLATPTDPPFALWDRASVPPERDRFTDRPYCGLRYHAPTKSFYICAFSGIDKPRTEADRIAFSKNLTDAVLRYDLRTQRWHEVERHDIGAGGTYPHHDPAVSAPPHGWTNGPDNCLAVGHWLYVVAKDNSCLVQYDLRALEDDPNAGAPPSRVVLADRAEVAGHGEMSLRGHSALAHHDGWLYVAFRTSSQIVRFRLDDESELVTPIVGELVALLDPFEPVTGRSANITDMCFDDAGRLYVISAKPSRVHRFTPDPRRIYDARDGRVEPWLDLAERVGMPKMKSENLLYRDGWLYVTSGNGYDWQAGADGTVYRVSVED